MAGPLTQDDAARIRSLYEDRLAAHGHDVRTVGWGSEEDQRLRFEVLCRRISLKGKHILDIGCGLGDLVPYLHDRTDGDFTYTGVDLSAALIERAEARYGGANRRFIAGDMAETVLPAADIALLSGALSFRVADNLAFAHAVLSRTFEAVREVLSANFLTSYVDYQLDKNFHYSPESMFTFARSLTGSVSLYHDYPLWEFTLQMRKQPDGERSHDDA